MENYKVGFIGAGNMAEAIFSGAIKSEVLKNEQIFIYDISKQRMSDLVSTYQIASYDSIVELAKNTDMLFLAVKPNILDEVLEYLNELNIDLNLVSIVAGWSGQKIKSFFTGKKKVKVLRTMPNMPLQCGEGMTVFESSYDLTKEVYMFVKRIFQSIGLVSLQKPQLMDAVTSISGSGPAYAFMFIEALADAGVLNGLSRNDAVLLSAQTVLGAAKTVLDTGIHPAKLKDNVCSPGGTTIEAVKVLEEKGFRSSIIEAANACADKSKKL
jgi:pyrroline-5-carboxylate reductase